MNLFEYYTVIRYKAGQLVTIDNVVYRCKTCKSCSGCNECEIRRDMNREYESLMHYYKICTKCGLFTTFKRLSK